MSIAYGIISVVALILIGVCFAVDKRRDIWLLLMFIAVFFGELGYFFISVAPSLEFALNANRLAYLGSVFLPLFLLMMILNLCGIKYRRWVPVVLCGVSVIILLLAASPGVLACYYKTVSIEVVNGITKLVREYGPLHLIYYLYLFAYLIAMLACILYSAAKKRLSSRLHVAFLLAAALCNIIIWLAEQFLPRGFEFLSVSYIMSEVFILLLYAILQEYDLISSKYDEKEQRSLVTSTYFVTDVHNSGKQFFSPVEINNIFANCDLISDFTEREKDVFVRILANQKRKDIASELFVSESTIKKYTASVFRKMNVSNRLELFSKLKHYA